MTLIPANYQNLVPFYEQQIDFHNQTENVSLNSIEDLHELPEKFGEILANSWLMFAKQYEKNHVKDDEKLAFLQDIRLNLSTIEKMDDKKKLVHSGFISKIASFSEEECDCLIRFFEGTIHLDSDNCFFYIFIDLKKALNADDEQIDDQITKGVFLRIGTYDERFSTAISRMPDDIKNLFLSGYRRKTELCKDFKIAEMWKSIDVDKINFKKLEEEFLQDIASEIKIRSIKPVEIRDLSDFIMCKLMDNEISLDTLNLKDEALNFINLTGFLPLFNSKLQEKPLCFFYWLGINRSHKIRKLVFRKDDLQNYFPIKDLNLICSNLDELHFSNLLTSCSKEKWLDDLEVICSFLTIKKLNLSNINISFLGDFFDKASKFKLLENLELDCIADSDSSKEKYLNIFENLPTLEGISKLTWTESERSSYVDGESYKILFSKFPNISELTIHGNKWERQDECIKQAADLKKLKKLNIFGYTVDNDAFKKLTQITDLSLSSLPWCCSYPYSLDLNESPYFFFPRNIKHLYVCDKEIHIPSLPLAIIEKVSKNIVKNAIEVVHPSYFRGNPPRIKQLVGISLAVYGIYSIMKPQTTSLPATTIPSLLILPSYQKIGMITAGVFLSLAAAYYRFSNKQKFKVKFDKMNSMIGIVKEQMAGMTQFVVPS